VHRVVYEQDVGAAALLEVQTDPVVRPGDGVAVRNGVAVAAQGGGAAVREDCAQGVWARRRGDDGLGGPGDYQQVLRQRDGVDRQRGEVKQHAFWPVKRCELQVVRVGGTERQQRRVGVGVGVRGLRLPAEHVCHFLVDVRDLPRRRARLLPQRRHPTGEIARHVVSRGTAFCNLDN
jgi:hypothetical protein